MDMFRRFSRSLIPARTAPIAAARRRRGQGRPSIEALEGRALLTTSGLTFGLGGTDIVATGTAIDVAGNTYITGGFKGTVDFSSKLGAASTTSSTLTSLGGRDVFLA